MSGNSDITRAIIARVEAADGALGGPISEHEAEWIASRESEADADDIRLIGRGACDKIIAIWRDAYTAARTDLAARVAELEAALSGLLNCPAIADGDLNNPEFGCGESAQAESCARAALKGDA